MSDDTSFQENPRLLLLVSQRFIDIERENHGVVLLYASFLQTLQISEFLGISVMQGIMTNDMTIENGPLTLEGGPLQLPGVPEVLPAIVYPEPVHPMVDEGDEMEDAPPVNAEQAVEVFQSPAPRRRIRAKDVVYVIVPPDRNTAAANLVMIAGDARPNTEDIGAWQEAIQTPGKLPLRVLRRLVTQRNRVKMLTDQFIPTRSVMYVLDKDYIYMEDSSIYYGSISSLSLSMRETFSKHKASLLVNPRSNPKGFIQNKNTTHVHENNTVRQVSTKEQIKAYSIKVTSSQSYIPVRVPDHGFPDDVYTRTISSIIRASDRAMTRHLQNYMKEIMNTENMKQRRSYMIESARPYRQLPKTLPPELQPLANEYRVLSDIQTELFVQFDVFQRNDLALFLSGRLMDPQILLGIWNVIRARLLVRFQIAHILFLHTIYNANEGSIMRAMNDHKWKFTNSGDFSHFMMFMRDLFLHEPILCINPETFSFSPRVLRKYGIVASPMTQDSIIGYTHSAYTWIISQLEGSADPLFPIERDELAKHFKSWLGDSITHMIENLPNEQRNQLIDSPRKLGYIELLSKYQHMLPA
jgi:hypothetical protein